MRATTAVSIVPIACWLVWLAYWLVSANRVKDTLQSEDPNTRTPYVHLMGVAFLLLASSGKIYPLSLPLLPRTFALRAAGDLICLVGTVFTIWARYVLADNWSAMVTLKHDHELIERGPYALVRHPIYSGMLLMFLGTAMVTDAVGAFAALALCFAGFCNKLHREEALMLRHFPQSYPQYQRRVKRLVPGVW